MGAIEGSPADQALPAESGTGEPVVDGEIGHGSGRIVRFGSVELEERGNVALVTIRRPEVRNAVDESVALGLEAAIDHTEENAMLWTGVLAGEGTVFCAGADLNSIAAGRGATLHTARGGFAGLVARSRSKPLIAAVEGPALAGGAELVLACDLVVASRRASFGLPEVKRSLVAAGGGAFRTSLKLPRNVAMELLLTGSPLAADRAHHFGLVNVLTEEGNAVAAALELASGIGCNAPLAVRASRRLLLETAGISESDAFAASHAARQSLVGTADYEEGPLSFLEKRSPRWVGK